jgi:hypothetical protein
VTGATADDVAEADPPGTDGSARVDLLELYPNRTFRLCPSNRDMVGRLLDRMIAAHRRGAYEFGDDRTVRPMLLSPDATDDPYADDLAAAFRYRLEKLADNHRLGPIDSCRVRLGRLVPGPDQDAPVKVREAWELANRINAASMPTDNLVFPWVFISSQPEATLLLLDALAERPQRVDLSQVGFSGPPLGPFWVACGDALGRDFYRNNAGRLLPFDVWSVGIRPAGRDLWAQAGAAPARTVLETVDLLLAGFAAAPAAAARRGGEAAALLHVLEARRGSTDPAAFDARGRRLRPGELIEVYRRNRRDGTTTVYTGPDGTPAWTEGRPLGLAAARSESRGE